MRAQDMNNSYNSLYIWKVLENKSRIKNLDNSKIYRCKINIQEYKTVFPLCDLCFVICEKIISPFVFDQVTSVTFLQDRIHSACAALSCQFHVQISLSRPQGSLPRAQTWGNSKEQVEEDNSEKWQRFYDMKNHKLLDSWFSNRSKSFFFKKRHRF